MADSKSVKVIPDPTEFGVVTASLKIYVDGDTGVKSFNVGYIKPDAPNDSLRAAAHGLVSLTSDWFYACEKTYEEILETWH